jgi:uncharacterized iron-regulated membrane protein
MNATASASVRISPRARTRMIWLTVHKWLGLGLLVIMAAFGATGAALVWPTASDALVHPARYPATEAAAFRPSAQWLQSAATELGADDRISGIRWPDGGHGAIMVAGQTSGPPPLGLGPPTRTRIWIDPQTGATLDRSTSNAEFLWAMHAIHGHLLLKGWGREAVALTGLFLLVSSVSGIVLWWPGWSRAARALKWQRSYSASMNIHRQSGIIVALIIVVEAATGIYVALPGVFAAIVEPGAVTARAQMEGPPPSPPVAQPNVDVAVVVAAAEAAVPNQSRLQSVFLPLENRSAWTINFHTPAGPATVHVSDLDGATEIEPTLSLSRADEVEQVMIDVHFGRLGTVWQIIVFLSGIALVVLPITGLLIWLRRRRKRAVARP